MEKKVIPTGEIAANCTILWWENGRALIVDPGADADLLTDFLRDKHLTPIAIALTHAHFDHIGGIPGLRKAWGELPVYVHAQDRVMIGHPMNAWESSYPQVGALSNLQDIHQLPTLLGDAAALSIIETPGHTLGGVCLYFAKDHFVLTGDTLFAGSVGRTDFPGGSMDALRESLAKLMALPPETDVIPGHGMPTTIGREKESNPYIS